MRMFLVSYTFSTNDGSSGVGRLFIKTSHRTSRALIESWEKIVIDANPAFVHCGISNFIELEESE